MTTVQHECYTDDWQRTEPDFVVHLPRTPGGSDGYADHFLVSVTPGGDLLAMWTMSAIEGAHAARVVCARSEDNGQNWTPPQKIVGKDEDGGEMAEFGFPVISRSGRIYCYYNLGTGICDIDPRVSTVLGCHVSDDDGRTWQDSGVITGYGRIDNDHPDPKVPCNCIVWQKPVLDAKGRPIVALTHGSSLEKYPFTVPNFHGRTMGDSQGQLMRFDNIDDGPDPSDVKITWLPPGNELRHPIGPMYPVENAKGYSSYHEPSTALLPDGRLFVPASTVSGFLIYSVSEDADGQTFRKPDVLRYTDHGAPLQHPVAPAPIYGLEDGRFLIFYHAHDGTKHGGLSPRDMRGRRPTCVCVGEFRPNAQQPIWFSQPKQLCDTHGVGVGPEVLVWLAQYSSMTEHNGQRVYWYTDRKFFALGRIISDAWLADMAVPG